MWNLETITKNTQTKNYWKKETKLKKEKQNATIETKEWRQM